MKVNPANQEELTARIDITKTGTLDFKLGSKSWNIDLGKSVDPRFLTYTPNSENVRVTLNAGKYTFRFNMRNYTYNFEKL